MLQLQYFFSNEQLNFELPLNCMIFLHSFATVQKPVQPHPHTHKKRLNINVFLSLFLHYFTNFGHIFVFKIAPEHISKYNFRIVKTFL